MSRTQVKPDLFAEFKMLQGQVAALQRMSNVAGLRDIDTTGLTSAQIDAQMFSGSQPYNGARLSDSLNNLYLLRMSDPESGNLNGLWHYVTMTDIL